VSGRDIEGGEELINFKSLYRQGDHSQGKCRGRRGDIRLVESLEPSGERENKGRAG
jgi:hypothetical protein